MSEETTVKAKTRRTKKVTNAPIKNNMLKVKDVRQLLKDTEVNTADMVELINVSFVADEDYILRKPNSEYIKREIEWYKSQSLFVKDIPGQVPQIWENVASTEGKINSNYGWCIFSADNNYQYTSARNHLIVDKNTRKAIMVYTRPSIQQDWNKNGMSDFICTNNVQLFIRDNKLIYIINQRSCDAVFGYNNDIAWHKHVYEMLYEDLVDVYPELEKTDIEYVIGTLHVYSKHQHLIKDL